MKIPVGKIIVSLVFVFAAVLTVRTVLAVTSSPNLFKNILPLVKVDPWAVRCSAIQSLAEKRLNKFEDNKNKHYKIYVQLTTLLSEKIDKWDSLGLDTKKLKADLAVEEEKIKKFEDDYTTYRSKLEDIGKIDCHNTSDDYANAVKGAKDALKIVRKDVVDIKTYYWTQIRPDIMDLKKQVIPNSGE